LKAIQGLVQSRKSSKAGVIAISSGHRLSPARLTINFNESWQVKAPGFFVANLWTEFAASCGDVLIANGKKPQNPNKLVVAATFEKAKP
jgi:hypothetical protein